MKIAAPLRAAATALLALGLALPALAKPPPHAPAHGYRHKHPDGVELAFDSAVGAYAVIGFSQHFFVGEHFLRWHGGAWQQSVSIRGPWVPAPPKLVPGKLRVRFPLPAPLAPLDPGPGKSKRGPRGKPGRGGR